MSVPAVRIAYSAPRATLTRCRWISKRHERTAESMRRRWPITVTGRRFADLLIASVALANSLPVVTRNAADFVGLDGLIIVSEI